MTDANITAADVLAAIRKKHSSDAVIREVVISDPIEAAIRRRDQLDRYGERWARHFKGREVADVVPEGWSLRGSIPTRRIDALILNGQQTTAIEIKVTRADFRRETSEKRRAWAAVSNRFVYAAPVGVIPRGEVPEGCGLWEFDSAAAGPYPWQHGLTTVVRARLNKDPHPLPRQILVALAYRVARSESTAG